MSFTSSRTGKAIVASTMALVLGGAGALASEMSVAAVLTAGYNISSIVLLPSGQLQKLGQTNPSPQLLITLQRGTSVAACTVGVGDWEYLNDNAVNTATSCDVH